MALNNPLAHARSISTSSSHSASSSALYGNTDLTGYSSATASPFSRHLTSHNGTGAHNRTFSGASTSAFTQITSPADSPPDLALGAGPPSSHFSAHSLSAGHHSAFKSTALARSASYTHRSRSRPYDAVGHGLGGRTGLGGVPDEYPGFSSSVPSSSRSSSSCSDAEQDDISLTSMFQQSASSYHPHLQGASPLGGQPADYTGLFVAAPPAQHHQPQGFGIHPNQLGGVSQHQSHAQHGASFPAGGLAAGPLDAASAFGGMGQGLSAEAQLEQLAANVRSSTTTTASDRAKQVFVQAWLSGNYAPYPDGNVPRQGLYNSYRQVCDLHNIPHINTATLGKAIRLCFPNIKTRRLGVRGNSKYHYCGIRPATVTEAEFLQDFVRRTTNHAAIAASSRRGAAAVAAAQAAGHGNGSDEEDDEDSEVSSSGAPVGFGDSKDSSVPPATFGFGNTHSNAPAPLGAPNAPLPLTLGGGLKSPTLYTMLGDDKTPTTNSLLSAAQAASLNGRIGASNANSGLTYGAHAQIRGRRGLGSTDSPQLSNAAPGSRPGTSSGFNTAGPSPPVGSVSVSVKSLPNFPSINEALGIDASATKPPGTAGSDTGAESSNSTGSPSSQSGAAIGTNNSASPHHQAAIEVWRWFEDHLDGVLDSVRSLRFDQFEIHVRTFWGSLNGDYREVVHAPAVAGLVVRADAVVYDEILEILRSQMLSTIPVHALTSLRQLAEKMEKILLFALEGYGNTFVEPKVELGARFGHLVLRFLDMYQITQALTSVLSNTQQIADMRRAWQDIDFESVRNQSALVCNCRHEDLLQLLEVDFVAVLDGLVANAQLGALVGSTDPVREIMNWADMCCERLMGRGNGGADGEEKATMSSRSVLIRWGYVTSQVMRDLTIRSDPAFGAFQILKLFLDDWIALNVLRSVALSTNSVQASVEPVMHHQYLALSPMPGQEFTGTATSSGTSILPAHSSLTAQLMDHTPTTSSMLAALHDSFNTTQQTSSSAHGAHQHPLANSTTFDSFSYGSVDASGYFSDHGSSFDMSFLNGSHDVDQAHSPAAQSVGSSASVADLTAGVAATGVGGSEAGESPMPRRRESDDSVEVKHETL